MLPRASSTQDLLERFSRPFYHQSTPLFTSSLIVQVQEFYLTSLLTLISSYVLVIVATHQLSSIFFFRSVTVADRKNTQSVSKCTTWMLGPSPLLFFFNSVPIQVVDSPMLAEGEATFMITPGGVADATWKLLHYMDLAWFYNSLSLSYNYFTSHDVLPFQSLNRQFCILNFLVFVQLQKCACTKSRSFL